AGLAKDSVVLTEQVRTIDKRRLREKVSSVDEKLMEKINHALEISLGLIDL
ncbi:MAG: type II toxin-antitoxin system PemK/MazF family toxin, partial [Peptococcales bacterium]